ncbi:EAL domain-containing protein [Vibrio sp. HN007]|uniref:sensor domain-containing protein n=1 Tax=Vibrio iocasae TaxID=3098914 RepID=UPI0035D4730C
MAPDITRAVTSLLKDDSDENRFLQLIDALPKISVQGYDKNRNVIYWNKSSTELYGYEKEEAIGRKLEDLIIPEEMREHVIMFHKDWVEKGIPIPSSELILKRKDGSPIPVFSSHVMLKQGTDSPEMFCVDVDLREQYEAREKLRTTATTDSLTSLPNRLCLEEELTKRVSEASRFNHKLAILFIDLDMFKEVNDTLGHTWGDKLLTSVAKRMRTSLREYDFLARFGGDEFVLVIPRIESAEEARIIANKLIGSFSSSFSLGDENLFITTSIGICLYPEDGTKPEELLKNADTAMYHAKETGRNRYHFFTTSLSDEIRLQRDISAHLHESLEKDEFELVYQPQYDMANREITACEALLRWTPEIKERSVTPDIFIPIAERSDLIVKLGDWVIEKACAQQKEWKKAGINTRIDINVSGKQLEQTDFFASLNACRERYGLSPEELGIELTEHTLIKSNNRMLDELRKQRAKGMEISIDDFGTGYSSLNYLKLFPITKLKIDRTFIADAPENDLDGALLEAIVNVGHKLKLNIVVEGVESELQAQFCKNLNIDLAQGYWYCRPLSVENVTSLLSSDKTRD